jgi:hypothetical protein
MSIIKNVSGPYTINTINHEDPITLDSNVVIINGNLRINGDTYMLNYTTASVSNTYIADSTITLNQGVTGTPILNAGLEVNRGTSPKVYLYWNEDVNQWQITNDGTLFSNIVATSTGVTKLNEDSAPELSANLNVGPNWIVSNTSIHLTSSQTINTEAPLALKISATSPSALPHFNILHGGNVAAGGTGVYVTAGEQNIVSEELISKKRAIVYSIIF